MEITLLQPGHDLQVMTPGIYRMGNEDYHRSNGLSRSSLLDLERSPLHYQTAKAAADESTAAMILGTAFHVKVLEPSSFDEHVVAAPEVDRRTNAGKEVWGRFVNQHAGKIHLKPADYEMVSRMGDAVLANPIARALMSGGESELSYYAMLEDVLCKCRPDHYRPGKAWGLGDLKSCADARPGPFARACWDHGYYVQSAFYCDVASEARGEEITNFFFVAVEKTPPYAVAVYLADLEMMQAGRVAYRRALRTYRECVSRNEWPAYPVEITPLSLPYWATKELFDE